jgi:apolipoprotein N-acyltransferase
VDHAPGRGSIRVAVVQASMPDDGDGLDKLETYERLTREAAARGATLVIWPESAVPFRIDGYAAYRQRIETLARSSNVDLVLGSITTASAGGFYNSNALVRADAGLTAIQPKRVLVPFGEYLPLRFMLGKVPALAWEAGDDLLAGPEPVALEGREARVGALVCYEAVFPGLAADLAGRGVELLANTTNDSWFGWTAGSWQHLQHALLRAVETGRPLARAANSGISALVTRRGEVVAQLGLGERGLLVADLELGSVAPPGAVIGPGVARACAIVAAVLLAIALYWRFSAGLPRGAGPSPPAAATGRGENPACDGMREGTRDGMREGTREGTDDA